MLAEIEKFLVLQDRDQKLVRLQKELERIPADLENARSRLRADEESVTAAQEKLNANDVATKNLELDIQTRRETIGRLKTQQFETRKNEEFRALGHEVERYQTEITGLEDQELELMETGEGLKTTLATARERYDATKAQVDEELATLEQRKASCQNQIDELTADRGVLAEGIDEALLDRYGRIFKQKKDAAVVSLDHGVCSGCHMKVTSATLHDVKGGAVITYCENCGRVLYPGEG